MTDQYRATPEQWRLIEEDDAQAPSCILELRARIEALEAAQLEQAQVRALSWAIVRRVEAMEAAQRAIRSGPESPLVERVADAIAGQATSAGIVNDRPARAAIREVAKWLRENKYVVPTMDQRLFESEATTTADIAAESASIIVAFIEQEADRD
jgi:hypothetical protein